MSEVKMSPLEYMAKGSEKGDVGEWFEHLFNFYDIGSADKAIIDKDVSAVNAIVGLAQAYELERIADTLGEINNKLNKEKK